MDRRAVYMRPCVANCYDSERKEVVQINGFFHGWGVSYEEFESGPGNYTTAIVEDMKGVCHECWTNVNFLDVGRKSQ